MSVYQITVVRDGKFLFRTENAPCDSSHVEAYDMFELLKAKFPEHEQYAIRLVISSPQRAGTMHS